jgi:hypothetical protein
LLNEEKEKKGNVRGRCGTPADRALGANDRQFNFHVKKGLLCKSI